MIARGSQIELLKKWNEINDELFIDLIESSEFDYDKRTEWLIPQNEKDYFKDLEGQASHYPGQDVTIIFFSGKIRKDREPFIYYTYNEYTISFIIYENEQIILNKLIKLYKLWSFS